MEDSEDYSQIEIPKLKKVIRPLHPCKNCGQLTETYYCDSKCKKDYKERECDIIE